MAYTSHILDQIKTLGFQQATATSISLGIDDLLTIPSKRWLVQDAEQQSLILEKHHHYGNVHVVEKLRQSIEICSDPSLSLNSSANVNQSWYNRFSDSIDNLYCDSDKYNYECYIRPILFISTYENAYSTFVFGFFNNKGTNATKDGSFLVIAWLPLRSNIEPVVLWCANRDNPVRENATLHFTSNGGLELKDADGTLIWPTNTSALPVIRLNISDGANLMLLGSKDNVIWQSFDYPTDTWLPNQNISSNKGLTSSKSSSNLGTGLYSLTLEEGVHSNSLVAFINSDPPQKYNSQPVDYSIYLNDYSSIEGFSNNALFNVNRRAHRFPYIRLEPNGHLNFYQLPYYNESRIASSNIFRQYSESDCDYPTVCGNYGVCSENGLCSCPGAGGNYSYFTQLQDLKPNLGCRPVTPLSCKDAHLHTFLELNGVTYFNFEFHYSKMDRDSCKKACSDNCTCKAAFFSSGNCSLQSQLYSLKSSTYNDSVTFVKVQNQALSTHNQAPKDKRKLTLVAVLVSTLSVGLVIIPVVSCYCYKMRINRINKEEEEGDDQSCPLINVVKEKAENDQLHDLVDGYLEDIQFQKEEAEKMIKIGIWCLQAHNTRPPISTVLKVLEGSMDLGPASEFCYATTLPTESHLRANSAQLSTPPAASILSGPR
ncbi:hypothetical protein LguiB_021256 [Lonicera macranthoides]